MQHYKSIGLGVNNITFSFDPTPLPSVSQLADGKTKKVQAKITLARPPKLNIFHRDRWKCEEKRSIFFSIIMVELYGGLIKNFVSLFCISFKVRTLKGKILKEMNKKKRMMKVLYSCFCILRTILSFNLNSSDCKGSNVVFSSAIISTIQLTTPEKRQKTM